MKSHPHLKVSPRLKTKDNPTGCNYSQVSYSHGTSTVLRAKTIP